MVEQLVRPTDQGPLAHVDPTADPSQGEIDALDNDGYLVFPKLIDPEWLEGLRSEFEGEDNFDVDAPLIKERGTRHINDLVNRGPALEAVYTNAKVLAAVYHILKTPFRLGQLNGRDPLPGYGQQGLHADWPARVKGEPFRIVTTIWLLDDFTQDNGATRVVPGTHRLLNPPPKSFADPASRHPDQKIIVASAGSVLIFNGHLWHSGTRNQTHRARRALQCSFVGRDEFHFGELKIDHPERLSPAGRYILGKEG